jgi:hypothetical protein
MKSETLKHFEDMEDPRVVGRTIHPLRNIVFITIVGALCGLTGWEEIADFAKYRKGFFSKYIGTVANYQNKYSKLTPSVL